MTTRIDTRGPYRMRRRVQRIILTRLGVAAGISFLWAVGVPLVVHPGIFLGDLWDGIVSMLYGMLHVL